MYKFDSIKNDIGLKTWNKKMIAKNRSYRNMKTQNIEREKPSFPKEQVENADLYKPILNKIITAHE